MSIQDPSQRVGFIGGTDVQHLLQLDPWGCRRKLWYAKAGTPEDKPFTPSGPMIRGTALEAHVAELVKDRTGWNIRRKAASANSHELQRVDREIVGHERGPGVLEIKVIGDRSYWDWQRDGVPLGYQMQVQWYLHVLKRSWACLAAWNCDTGQLALFEFEARPVMMESVSRNAAAFMEQVKAGTPPPWLEERDGRCESCQWEPTCQMAEWAGVHDGGLVQIDGLPALMADYQRAKEVEKKAKAFQAELRDGCPEAKEESRRLGIDALLGNNEQARASADERVLFKVQESLRVDTDLLKTKYPDVYGDVLQRSVSRPLRIVKIKQGAK